MKRFFFAMLVAVLTVSVAESSNKGSGKGGVHPGSAKVSRSSGGFHSRPGTKMSGSMRNHRPNHQGHQQHFSRYRVPGHLHSHCYTHSDFRWSRSCWLPRFGCCGYWNQSSSCWYYWYQPYCCYLPCTYIDTYQPVAVARQGTVVPTGITVNVTNTNTNINGGGGLSSLPPGASADLPPGVNPNIPAPRQ